MSEENFRLIEQLNHMVNQCLNLQEELSLNPKICGDKCKVDFCFHVCTLKKNHKGAGEFDPNIHSHDSRNYSLPIKIHSW